MEITQGAEQRERGFKVSPHERSFALVLASADVATAGAAAATRHKLGEGNADVEVLTLSNLRLCDT
jgi:hypothetical protein